MKEELEWNILLQFLKDPKALKFKWSTKIYPLLPCLIHARDILYMKEDLPLKNAITFSNVFENTEVQVDAFCPPTSLEE